MPLTHDELKRLETILAERLAASPSGADVSDEAELLGRVVQCQTELEAEQGHLMAVLAKMDEDQDDLMGCREWDNAQDGSDLKCPSCGRTASECPSAECHRGMGSEGA